MLSIPKKVKELLHTDSVNKNIRIHFPNGERSDICNDQIVKDSVEFTESLCSQTELKFGLCESPILECEVVGVGNIQGAVIEVYCEVYCSSSITGSVWKSDLQHYVYQIPYGVFIVKSSTRQSDMIHRKIVAYNQEAVNGWHLYQTENVKKTNGSYTGDYTPNVGYFLAANGANLIGGISEEEQVTQIIDFSEKELIFGAPSFSNRGNVYLTGKAIVFANTTNPDYPSSNIIDDFEAIYYAHKPQYNISRDEFEGIYNQINTLYSDDNSGSWDWMRKLIPSIIYDGGIYMSVQDRDQPNVKAGFKNAGCFFTPFYPYISGFYGRPLDAIRIVIITSVRIEVLETRTVPNVVLYDETFNLTDDIPRFTKRKYNFFNPFWSTLRITIPVDKEGYQWHKIIFDDVDIQKLANSFTELTGCFLKTNRDASQSLINIKEKFLLSPASGLYPGSDLFPKGATGGKLLPQDYQTCWYDDDYEKYYGAIQIAYKNTNDEDAVYTLYLNGFSSNSDTSSYKTYYMTNNEFIRGRKWTSEDIRLISEGIAANLQGITYMPVEFVGRGLPYVEAGDTFEILTKSNDSITTIVLKRVIKGEQHLVDSYKSV